MKRTLILSAAAFLLTAFSLGYFLWLRPSQAETNLPEKIAETNKTRSNLIAAPGVVEAASEEIEVGAEISGKLKAVTVEEGDSVTRGQPIAVLENSDYKTQVETARTNIETLRRQKETARARLVQAETDKSRIANGARPEERIEARNAFEQNLPTVENARRELARREKLYASGDVSREELERARRDYDTAQKQSQTSRERFNVVNAAARADDLAKAEAIIQTAAAQLREFDALIKEAEARVRQAEAALEKTIVRAPIAGIVLRKRLRAGESVSPENQSGIVTIADVSALRVRVDIDEIDVADIKQGQRVYVTADAFGTRKFTGRVVKIGQILGRKNVRTERPTEKVDTKILETLVELDPNQTLPLGLRVDAFILLGDATN